MLKLISLSHPLAELLFARNNPTQFKCDQNELFDLFMKIQVLEKVAISKYNFFCLKEKDFIICVDNFPITVEYTDDFPNILLKEEEYNIDLFAVLTQYAIIAWYQSFFNIDQKNLCTILYIFKRAIDLKCNFPYAPFFSLILSKYIQNGSTSFSQTFFQLVFEQIESNIFPNPSYFPQLIGLFRCVIASRIQESNQEMISLIDKLITEEAPVIDIPNQHVPILFMLQPFVANLSTKAFGIACKISHLYEYKTLNDAFIVIPSALLSYAIQQYNNEHKKMINNNNISNSDFDGNPFHFDEINGNKQYQFEDHFPNLCFNFLDCSFEFEPKETQEIANEIAECLNIASNSMKELFLTTMLNLMSTLIDINHIYQYFALFFIILSKSGNEDVLQSIWSLLLSNSFFQMSSHIFSNEKEHMITKNTSYLRKQLIDAISKYLPSSLIKLIDPHFPLFASEIVLRAQLSNFDPILLSSEAFLKKYSECFFSLKSLTRTKETIYAQYAFYSFFSYLVSQEKSKEVLLSSSYFISYFVTYIYEPKLSHLTFSIIMQSITYISKETDISALSDLFSKAAISLTKENKKSINKTLKNENVKQIGLELSYLLGEALSDDTVEKFEECLVPMLEFIINTKSVQILTNILNFMKKLINAKHDFAEKYIHTIQNLSQKAIQSVECDKKSILYILLEILTLSSSVNVCESIAIVIPWILPIIVSSFSDNDELIKYTFSRLLRLAEVSDENCRKMHDGDLDLILLNILISRGELYQYYQMEIQLHIPYETIEKYVFPLLSLIFRNKSSNIIASKAIEFMNSCARKDLLPYNFRFILNELVFESNLPRYKFPIGMKYPLYTIPNISANDLNNGFTITFYMKADFVVLPRETTSINLFTFKSDNLSFVVCLRNSSICADIIAQNQRIPSILTKQIKSQKWIQYLVTVDMSQQHSVLSSYYEMKWENNAELPKFLFGSDVTLVVGDDNNEETTCLMISEFSIYKDFVDYLHPSFGELLISTESLKSNGLSSEQNIGNYTVITNSYKRIPKMLIDCFAKVNNITKICTFFDVVNEQNDSNNIEFYQRYEELSIQILHILDLLIKYSPSTQKDFGHIEFLQRSIQRNSCLSTYSVYLSCWHIFLSLTDEELKLNWFKNIVFDLWNWINSKDDLFMTFLSILKHWQNTLLVNENIQEIILKSNYFSSFLSQFRLYFSLTEEYKRYLDESISIYFEFDKLSQEEINICKKEFLKLIQKIAYIHLSREDIQTLFLYIQTCTVKIIILDLLDFTLSIVPVINAISDWDMPMINTILSSFIEHKDIDVIEKMIYVIHNLSIVDFNISLQIFSLKFFNKDNYSQQSAQELYQRFFNNLEKYSKLYPLLIQLALHINNELIQLGLKMDHLKDFPMINQWFIWPLIASFQNSDVRDYFSSFIADNLMKSPKRDTDLFEIIYTALLLQNEVDVPADEAIKSLIFLIYDFIKTKQFELGNSITTDDDNFTKNFAYLCFSISCFHVSPDTHTKQLLDLFNNTEISPYPQYSIESSKTKSSISITDISQLEEIFSSDISSIPIGFIIELNKEKNEWKYKLLANIAINLLNDDCFQKKILMTILQRESLIESNKLVELQKNSLAKIDKELDLFRTHFKQTITSLSNNFMKLIDMANSIISNKTILSLNEPLVKSLLSNELHNNDIFINNQHENIHEQKLSHLLSDENGERMRDKTICIDFCAFKTKIKSPHRNKSKKKQITIPEHSQIVFEHNCHLVTLKRIRKIILKITKDLAVIQNEKCLKSFYLSSVKLLLTRKRNNQETSIEFYLSDGRSYLIDLLNINNLEFTINMKKYFTPDQIVQTVQSNEFFYQTQLSLNWMKGLISNFSYLMGINIISGRSFNDSSIYPIFPSVLRSFNILDVHKNGEQQIIKSFDTKDLTKNVTFNHPNIERILSLDSNNLLTESSQTMITSIPNEHQIQQSLEDAFCSSSCIAPDFYFYHQLIRDTDKLPEWTSDKYEFIYKMKMIFETDLVRQQLPKFIDVIWGKGMKVYDHRKIFMKRHSLSQKSIFDKVEETEWSPPIEKELLFATRIRRNNPNYFTFLLCDVNGVFYKYQFTFNMSQTQLTKVFIYPFSNEAITSNQQEEPKVYEQKDFVFSSSKVSTAVFSPNDNLLAIVNDFAVESKHTLFTDVPLISCSNEAFIFTSDESTVSYCRSANSYPISLMKTTERIVYITLYSIFKVFAVALQDGTVEVHSLKTGQFVGRSKLHMKAKNIIFTQAKGFIVCYSENELLVMDVDGNEMRRRPLKLRFQSMFTFTTHDDNDFILAIDEKKNCLFFNPLYPNDTKTVCTLKKEIIYATYDSLHQVFILVDKSSQFRLIPYKVL